MEINTIARRSTKTVCSVFREAGERCLFSASCKFHVSTLLCDIHNVCHRFYCQLIKPLFLMILFLPTLLAIHPCGETFCKGRCISGAFRRRNMAVDAFLGFCETLSQILATGPRPLPYDLSSVSMLFADDYRLRVVQVNSLLRHDICSRARHDRTTSRNV
jgi:hypothetical protein